MITFHCLGSAGSIGKAPLPAWEEELSMSVLVYVVWPYGYIFRLPCSSAHDVHSGMVGSQLWPKERGGRIG